MDFVGLKINRMPSESPFIRELPPGALDIVGDVHGELGPLQRLLRELGYAEDGEHAENRTLVFVGDLADRGPDSPGVVRLVRTLIERGRALAIMGNHELNLLRDAPKDGNGWAFRDNHDRNARKRPKYLHSTDATESERIEIRNFFAELPLVLQRRDLRIVHACWHSESLEALEQASSGIGIAAAFDFFETSIEKQIASSGVALQAEREQTQHRLDDPHTVPPLLLATAKLDELRQMGNPIRVLTSGVERGGTEPFFSSGKWRMVERVPWWNEYQDDNAVIVGHYWRWPSATVDRKAFEKDGPDLFADTRAHDWLGPKKNVFCVDFSIGRRFRERELGYAEGSCSKLGALRWPEREVVFEDGERIRTFYGRTA